MNKLEPVKIKIFRVVLTILSCFAAFGLFLIFLPSFLTDISAGQAVEYRYSGMTLSIASLGLILALVAIKKLKDDKTQKPPFVLSKKKTQSILVISCLLLFGLVLVYDLSGIGGNIRFYSKWIECGQRPLVGGALKGGPVYYKETQAISFMRGSQTYFCSPREAELNGHSSSSQGYEFQHLRPEEELGVRLKIIRGSSQ